MREAIGGSMLLYIVIFFVGTIILVFAGVMTYSKAYKAKNRIIEIVEEYGKYDDKTEEIISDSLKYMGYQTGNCKLISLNKSGYKYCIEKKEYNGNPKGIYYKVTTYLHLDFPVIGSMIDVPVVGETKILERNYSY